MNDLLCIMNRRLQILVINLITTVLLLVGLEAGVRFFFNELGPIGTDRSLIADNRYHSSRGLNPGAHGKSNGAYFEVDSLGFIKYTVPFFPRDKSILFLGDSVTMGIGVHPDLSFAGLFAQEVDSLNVLNPSLIGYASADYKNVITHILARSYGQDQPGLEIQEIVLFWCLNDIYSSIPIVDEPGGTVREIGGGLLAWIRRNVRTYQVLKGIMLDRPQTYYEHDAEFYLSGNAHFDKAVSDMQEIVQLCESYNVSLKLILLPYEYQLRETANIEHSPQAILEKHLPDHLAVMNLVKAFREYDGDKSELFLFGDGIHFSAKGHRLVASSLKSAL